MTEPISFLLPKLGQNSLYRRRYEPVITMKKTALLFLLAAAIPLAGCSTTGTGAAVGQFASPSKAPERPIVQDGGILPGTAAARIGADDTELALAAEFQALDAAAAGVPVQWRGRRGKNSGEVTAGQPYQVGAQNCRAYSHTVFIDGLPETARGTACRTDEGQWVPLT